MADQDSTALFEASSLVADHLTYHCCRFSIDSNIWPVIYSKELFKRDVETLTFALLEDTEEMLERRSDTLTQWYRKLDRGTVTIYFEVQSDEPTARTNESADFGQAR